MHVWSRWNPDPGSGMGRREIGAAIQGLCAEYGFGEPSSASVILVWIGSRIGPIGEGRPDVRLAEAVCGRMARRACWRMVRGDGGESGDDGGLQSSLCRRSN